MALEFRLLGEIDARVDDRLVEAGHPRQRAVLAALLVDVNQAVPIDELVERVWSHRVPQRARGTVYSYVTRLRRALAPAGNAVEIARRAGGYVLVVDSMVVDLHRFNLLLAQARSAADDQTRMALLQQALGLWRGPTLAGLDTPWFNAVRAAVDKQRLSAELDRNDVALRLGRHTELLADLTTAAEAHPFDERLAGQLILALYRCGRQNEALAGYRQIRRRLADEVGTDPSPPLQRLHQQILQADPALAAPIHVASTRGGPPPAALPRQLPAPVPHFIGRASELATLTELLEQACDTRTTVLISAIAGTAGIGKTALALHWAHRVADRFRDGQLYVNLRGFDPTGVPVTATEAVRGFLDALAVPVERIPASLDAQAALYRSLVADKRMLIVLDNARDGEQVRPLLPGAATCLVLITSRNQFTSLVAAEGAYPLTLNLLSPGEARDLLARRLGAARVNAEPTATDEIIARCARLPLALVIVAARAATNPRFPLSLLASELADAGARLTALEVADGDPTTNVRAVFSWSYHTLLPDAARLFRLLGLHPGPDISVAAAASLAALPISQVRPVLTELTRAHLLAEHLPGRYTFHDLLRAYASDLADSIDSDQQCHTATGRILDHYLHTANTAEGLLDPKRDPVTLAPPRPGVTPERPTDHQQALQWFTTEHPVLLATVDHAAATRFDTHTWQLASALHTFLYRRGHWHDWAATQQAAIAAAERLADPAAQAQAHRLLARAYTELGRLDDADTQLRHALDLGAQAGDLVGQARAHLHLGLVREHLGRHIDALDHDRQALDLYQRAGYLPGQAHALNNIGWHHSLLGDHQQALTHCQQALTLLQQLDDREGQCATWDSLGYAHHHLGHHVQAITCYQHALHLTRDLGDRYIEATILTHLGDTHQTVGDHAPARDAWQQALTILDQLDHPDADTIRAKLHDLAHTTPGAVEEEKMPWKKRKCN